MRIKKLSILAAIALLGLFPTTSHAAYSVSQGGTATSSFGAGGIVFSPGGLSPLTAVSTSSLGLDSFWASSTSNSIYSTNSGNVGIGTTTPQSLLTLASSSYPGAGLGFQIGPNTYGDGEQIVSGSVPGASLSFGPANGGELAAETDPEGCVSFNIQESPTAFGFNGGCGGAQLTGDGGGDFSFNNMSAVHFNSAYTGEDVLTLDGVHDGSLPAAEVSSDAYVNDDQRVAMGGVASRCDDGPGDAALDSWDVGSPGVVGEVCASYVDQDGTVHAIDSMDPSAVNDFHGIINADAGIFNSSNAAAIDTVNGILTDELGHQQLSWGSGGIGIRTSSSLFNALEVNGGTHVNGTLFAGVTQVNASASEAGQIVVSTSTSGSNTIVALFTGSKSATGGAGFLAGQDDGTAVTTGDRLGYNCFSGAQNTSHLLANGACITALAAEPWTTSSSGTKLEFQVTPDGVTGSAARITPLTINPTGDVGIGTTSPVADLTVVATGTDPDLLVVSTTTRVEVEVNNGGTLMGTSTSAATGKSDTLFVAANGDNPALELYGNALSSNAAFNVYDPLGAGTTTGKAFSIIPIVNGTIMSFATLQVASNGAVGWGSGTAARDAWLYRSATSTLTLDADQGGGAATLIVRGTLGVGTTTPTGVLSVASTTNTNVNLFTVDKNGNQIGGGAKPSVSCASTCTLDANAHDSSGIVYISGVQTAVTLTFATAKPYAPHCAVSDSSTAGTYDASTTPTQLAMASGLSLGTASISYVCQL